MFIYVLNDLVLIYYQESTSKNDWKAPYGPVPEPVPGLFCWKPVLKETHELPQSVPKIPKKNQKVDPQKNTHLVNIITPIK